MLRWEYDGLVTFGFQPSPAYLEVILAVIFGG